MATKKGTAKKKDEPKYACGLCGLTIPKHHKHCPVPKLTKNQVNWIVGKCFTTGDRFPLY
jgi:hypothetical protein